MHISHLCSGSRRPGESVVEQMAHNFEHRRANRLIIPMAVRRRLLAECRSIAIEKGYAKNRIHMADLQELRTEVEQELEAEQSRGVPLSTRLWNIVGVEQRDTELYLQLLDRAKEVVEGYQLASKTDSEECFYYQDFSFYYTKVVSRYPWMRPGLHHSFFLVLAYYMFAPLWFCVISRDTDICATQEGRGPFTGWVSALYFASTTLSTVGYGDLSVSKTRGPWEIVVGIAYMIFSNITLIAAFSAVAEHAFQPLQKYHDVFIDSIMGKATPHDLLWKKTRRLKYALFSELILQFILLNAIGVFASRLYIWTSDVPGQRWDWLTSIYWAVQTTTTIGTYQLH